MMLTVDIEHRQGDFSLRAAFASDRGLTALFGRSGSGKTTIVNAIAGLVRPQRGRIVIGDVAVFDSARKVWVPPHRRHVGYVFQEARLFPHLNVRQNLLYAQRFGGRGRPGATLDAVVEMLGIGPLLDRAPSSLSGGETQRVAIGRALLSHPRLLLMDEPLASLDEARKQEILPYIERLRDELGTPIVYVSHSLQEVRRLANAVVALDSGVVSAFGPPHAVLAGGGEEAWCEPTHTVLPASALEGAAGGLTRVATPAGDMLARGHVGAGEQVHVHIETNSIVVSVEPPATSGAFAVFAGVLVRIEEDAEPWLRLVVRVGEAEIAARALGAFARENGMAAGRNVHLMITDACVRADPAGPVTKSGLG